jgi:hypothetical protein
MPSEQQKKAAENIRYAFLIRKHRYAILKSNCQAGKTGCYQYLIRILLKNKEIDRAYVLCGSNEIELRSQAIDDTKQHNMEAFSRGDIKVIFRQDFEASEMCVKNALVVVDESHLDQTKGQQLDRFLERHGLSMDGNPTTLERENAYIVSVDATPYSEISALVHKQTPFHKHLENLLPGEGYIGIGDYMYQNKMEKTFDIAAEKSRFISLFKEKKYALIRLSTSGKSGRIQEEAIKQICGEYKINLLYYTADKTEIAITRKEQYSMRKEGKHIPCLEDEPERNTIVIIYGRLRAGKVVPKKNISFIWEGAKSSKTDALVQGLAGRMCGYSLKGDEEDVMKLDPDNLPLLFVPESCLERKETKIIPLSEMERTIQVPDIIPMKATNLKKSYLAEKAKARMEETPHGEISYIPNQCPPIKISFEKNSADGAWWNLKVEKFKEENRFGDSRNCFELLKKNIKKISDSLYISNEQKDEILNTIIKQPATSASLRNCYNDHRVTYFKNLVNAYDTNTTPSEHISGYPPLTFVVAYKGFNGLNIPGTSRFDVYAIFYTKASPGLHWIESTHLKSRIPETNGKSIFSFKSSSTASPLVAAGATGFSEVILKSPLSLEAGLRAYLKHWASSELLVTREIKSVSNKFEFSKSKFHYINASNNDVQRICVKLGTEFGLKIKPTFIRSPADVSGTFKVKSISW